MKSSTLTFLSKEIRSMLNIMHGYKWTKQAFYLNRMHIIKKSGIHLIYVHDYVIFS